MAKRHNKDTPLPKPTGDVTWLMSRLPAAAWHRGDHSSFQENSRRAIERSLQSPVPNVEVDVIDFVTTSGERVGLLAHEDNMARLTGVPRRFFTFHAIEQLPQNRVQPKLAPEPFMTVVEFFDLIHEYKGGGVIPIVSLDLAESGTTGETFGGWIGTLIKRYGFTDHVFAASRLKSNIVGLRKSCPECLMGGEIYQRHWALRYLDHGHTTLDLTTLSEITFFLGFLGKKNFHHDFVLIPDDLVFHHPEVMDIWRRERAVKFVGVYVFEKQRPYSADEWRILEKADWLELDPPQMNQYIERLQD